MSKFKDKFHLSPEQSLIFAKKRMDENIYCGMKMENREVTFPQTQTILNGVNVPNVQLDDIQAILNMRDAWKFLLNTVNEEVTFDYWCKLNGYIARNEALEWGKLRTGTVGISGPSAPRRARSLPSPSTDDPYSVVMSILSRGGKWCQSELFAAGNIRLIAEKPGPSLGYLPNASLIRRFSAPRDSP